MPPRIPFPPVSRTRPPQLTDGAAGGPRSTPDRDILRKMVRQETDELAKLQGKLLADGRFSLLVVLQGRDASGKDSTIRTVFDACTPTGLTVTSFKVPTPLELAHDYLWRVHDKIPPRGSIGIFNRSHYEDVLVVRVRQFVPRSVWTQRYAQINAFEKMLDDNGVAILKFFLHVSKDEQKKQLIERLEDPTKNWKFRAGDLDDRARWDDYTRAYRDALVKCSTPWAPWYVVPSDNRALRSYLIARTIVERLKELPLRYPRASRDVLALRDKIR